MRRPAQTASQAPATAGVPLETRAAAALAAGRHREAIEFYKELIKQERRREWVDGLAESYAGRAGELAKKGMLPEALAVWRNRANLCGKPLADGRYVDWLLRTGNHDAALRLLAERPDDAAASGSELETRLAAVALTASEAALASVPAESLLRRHRNAALAAIAACCRGHAAELEECLRQIPFRSPYRDLRFLLKSLLLSSSDSRQAAELVARVAADGPFERLAAVIRAAVLPGSEWLARLRSLDADGQQMLLEIKGCPESQRPLLLEIAALAGEGSSPAPTRIFDLLARRGRGLPPAAIGLLQRLLPLVNDRLGQYERNFGALGEADRECIRARTAESRDSVRSAVQFWLRAIGLLRRTEPLSAAMIQRHIFALTTQGDQPEDYSPQAIGWLRESIDLDPDDRATHLRLIEIHLDRRELPAARQVLEAAMKRFADEPSVLLAAVETALASNAFKKAVAVAKRLLVLDPINSRVRALIGRAHLSHARKQLRAKRPDVAEREIALADEWLAAPGERSVGGLLRGLARTDPAATVVLQQAVAELGGQLPATFQLLLECARIGVQPGPILRRVGISLAGTPASREVLAVAQAINALDASDDRSLKTVFATLEPALLRAAAGDFSETERIAVCEAWLRRDRFKLLRAYADAGLKRWPGRPALVYFKIYAKHDGDAWEYLSLSDERALESAAEEAARTGDDRTAVRIRQLLYPSDMPGRGHFHPLDDFIDQCDDDEQDGFPGDMSDWAPRIERFVNLMARGASAGQLIESARHLLSPDQFRTLEQAAGGNQRKLADLAVEKIHELMKSMFGAAIGGRPAPKATPTPAPTPLTPPLPEAASKAPARQPGADHRQKDLFDD